MPGTAKMEMLCTREVKVTRVNAEQTRIEEDERIVAKVTRGDWEGKERGEGKCS
jgi:hypothetical protein